MALTKIAIKNFRIFKDFSWTGNLQTFSKKNLIYGWNGTGKSTVAEILRSVEKKQSLTGNITLTFGERSVSGANIATETALPQIKVFNKAYIDENIFTAEGRATSIFYLGQESIDRQKEIEQLKVEVASNEKDTSSKIGVKQQQERDLDSFCIDKANTIKTNLRSNATGNTYNNYNKSNFKSKAESLLRLSETELNTKIFSHDQYQAQLRQTSATPKDQVTKLPTMDLDLAKLKTLIVGLLQETVTSQIIQELENDSNIANWVKQGLNLHKTETGYGSECSFCKNELKADRVEALEGHFNDAYNNFIQKLDRNLGYIDQKIAMFRSFRLPDKSSFYDSHIQSYAEAIKTFESGLASILEILEGVKIEVDEKKKNPFQAVTIKTFIPDTIDFSFDEINSIIDKNNADTNSFNQSVSAARSFIEEHIVASSLADYRIKKHSIELTTLEVSSLTNRKSELATKITDIERSIREDLKPAEELNKDIQSYLGRDELKFTVKDNGYELARGEIIATHLSEGEKTAIAFLHFLKSLADKNFNLENGIVVIDDPISSLDSNSIYHAFGFMKDRTQKAGQLFILTHNHTFFRQVKNWFNHLKGVDKKTARFYMIHSKLVQNERQSILAQLDSLLHEFESEYHFLYSVVREAAINENTELKFAYPLPNVSRRLIETFLAFKNPSGKNLQTKIEEAPFDTAKKNRILRFIHTYSHFDQIADSEHDPSILQESKAIMSDILAFIKAVDESHFNSMNDLFKTAGEDNTQIN